MCLLHKSPLLPLSKSAPISIGSTTNQKDSSDINDKEQQCMKVEVDLFSQNSNGTSDNPKGSKAITMVPEEVLAFDK